MLRGTVVTYPAARCDEHERATHASIARALASLRGFEFGGEYEAGAPYRGPLYFVPGDTLLPGQARELGICSASDLFGGVVPFPFVATKAIVHPLIAADAQAPRGWSHQFAERVRGDVLPGFTAFTVEDARKAATRLLAEGRVRLKAAHGVGGHGQSVINDVDGLEARLDLARLHRFGVVLELDTADATTFSVGQVCVAGMVASYCGTQRTTTNNSGRTVFGGSDLLVVRGGFDALEALSLGIESRRAVEQAQAFDAAAMDEFRGLFASRRNYDVLRGRDREGRWRSGVLEQSWRIGGASGPEVGALATLHAQPDLRAVHARSTETYGGARNTPPGAIVHYSGVDRRVGALTKFTVVEAHEFA
jgi:hypothetical protein